MAEAELGRLAPEAARDRVRVPKHIQIRTGRREHERTRG